MTEAVLAGKQVKQFPLEQAACTAAPPLTPFSRLSENFLVRDRPADARNRNREDDECEKFGTHGITPVGARRVPYGVPTGSNARVCGPPQNAMAPSDSPV